VGKPVEKNEKRNEGQKQKAEKRKNEQIEIK